jgi:hypothetical protein
VKTDGDPVTTGLGLDQTVSAPGTAPRASVEGIPDAIATPSNRGTGGGVGGRGDTELGPGAQLGRYVLVEPLGAGGMGMVFRARDPDLGREVAVKVLRAGDGSGGALERRLLREAQAMATVSHDNLANVFDIGVQAGRVFIAMELVDGGTLRKLFADATKTWRDKLAAVTGAGRGLAAAHSAGVIHRDFKPDNVLLAKSGRAKVVDFGLARADRDAPAAEMVAVDSSGPSASAALPPELSAHLTQTGALLGTPAYMAPEQHGGEVVDARSDQFAFAVTAWEAVYGQRPFKSEAYSSLVAAVRAHDIQPPPKIAGVPPALEAILRRALAPEPAARFTSMDALLTAIDDAIRPRTRVPWIAVGTAAGGTLLVAGVIIAVVLARSDDGTQPAAAIELSGSGSGSPATAAPPAPPVAPAPAARTAPHVEVVPFDPFELAAARDDGDDELALRQLRASQVVTTHARELVACYTAAGLDRAGRIVIELRVDKTGRVTKTTVITDELEGTGVARCVVEQTKSWRFHPEATTLRFPLVFHPEGDDSSGSMFGIPPEAMDEIMKQAGKYVPDVPGGVDIPDFDVPDTNPDVDVDVDVPDPPPAPPAPPKPPE